MAFRVAKFIQTVSKMKVSMGRKRLKEKKKVNCFRSEISSMARLKSSRKCCPSVYYPTLLNCVSPQLVVCYMFY